MIFPEPWARPKSELYTPKRDDEHPYLFYIRVPTAPPPPPPGDGFHCTRIGHFWTLSKSFAVVGAPSALPYPTHWTRCFGIAYIFLAPSLAFAGRFVVGKSKSVHTEKTGIGSCDWCFNSPILKLGCILLHVCIFRTIRQSMRKHSIRATIDKKKSFLPNRFEHWFFFFDFFKGGASFVECISFNKIYLTIIRRRRSEYCRIIPETKSRGLFDNSHWAWGE